MKFLVFEGLDGAGKSTLIKMVSDFLSQKSMEYLQVRDPGSTAVGDRLREIILDKNESPGARTEVLMYQAARAELVEKKIAPALESNQWVLSDRFYSSTIAFQAVARGCKRDDINWLNDFACSGIVPDLFVFIDITVEESQKRVQKRCGQTGESQDRMESENISFHESVRKGYLLQAKESPGNWLVLDGMKAPTDLFQDVLAELKKREWIQ